MSFQRKGIALYIPNTKWTNNRNIRVERKSWVILDTTTSQHSDLLPKSLLGLLTKIKRVLEDKVISFPLPNHLCSIKRLGNLIRWSVQKVFWNCIHILTDNMEITLWFPSHIQYPYIRFPLSFPQRNSILYVYCCMSDSSNLWSFLYIQFRSWWSKEPVVCEAMLWHTL